RPPKGTRGVVARLPAGGGAGGCLRRGGGVDGGGAPPVAGAVGRRGAGQSVPAAHAEGFENVPGYGALARVDGRKVAVGNTRLMDREGIDLGALASRGEEMTSAGRTVVWGAADGRAAALIGIAYAPRPTAA